MSTISRVTTRGIRSAIGLIVASGFVLVGLGLVTAAPASAACYPPGSSACSATLTASSSTVAPGGSFTLTGDGFSANAAVTVNVCNLETLTTTANAAGQIDLTVTIPSSAPAGPCTITASGLGSNGKALTTSTTITIVSGGSTVPPAHTGQPWSSPTYWMLAGAVGAAGFGFVAFGRRRHLRTTH